MAKEILSTRINRITYAVYSIMGPDRRGRDEETPEQKAKETITLCTPFWDKKEATEFYNHQCRTMHLSDGRILAVRLESGVVMKTDLIRDVSKPNKPLLCSCCGLPIL